MLEVREHAWGSVRLGTESQQLIYAKRSEPPGSASWLELAHAIRAALAQLIPTQEHPGPSKASGAPRIRSIQEHP